MGVRGRCRGAVADGADVWVGVAVGVWVGVDVQVAVGVKVDVGVKVGDGTIVLTTPRVGCGGPGWGGRRGGRGVGDELDGGAGGEGADERLLKDDRAEADDDAELGARAAPDADQVADREAVGGGDFEAGRAAGGGDDQEGAAGARGRLGLLVAFVALLERLLLGRRERAGTEPRVIRAGGVAAGGRLG